LRDVFIGSVRSRALFEVLDYDLPERRFPHHERKDRHDGGKGRLAQRQPEGEQAAILGRELVVTVCRFAARSRRRIWIQTTASQQALASRFRAIDRTIQECHSE
jgi:hypothetical protein